MAKDTPEAVSTTSPCLYLDFEGKDVKQLKGLKLGEKVHFHVTGTVKGLSQRQREDYETKKIRNVGSVDLMAYTVSLMDMDNEFTKMAEEEGE